MVFTTIAVCRLAGITSTPHPTSTFQHQRPDTKTLVPTSCGRKGALSNLSVMWLRSNVTLCRKSSCGNSKATVNF